MVIWFTIPAPNGGLGVVLVHPYTGGSGLKWAVPNVDGSPFKFLAWAADNIEIRSIPIDPAPTDLAGMGPSCVSFKDDDNGSKLDSKLIFKEFNKI